MIGIMDIISLCLRLFRQNQLGATHNASQHHVKMMENVKTCQISAIMFVHALPLTPEKIVKHPFLHVLVIHVKTVPNVSIQTITQIILVSVLKTKPPD